jgi:hypothetical protein
VSIHFVVKENAELSELAEADQEQNQRRENPEGQVQVQVQGEARMSGGVGECEKEGADVCQTDRCHFGDATSLFLTADSIVQSRLVGRSNANNETVEKL